MKEKIIKILDACTERKWDRNETADQIIELVKGIVSNLGRINADSSWYDKAISDVLEKLK